MFYQPVHVADQQHAARILQEHLRYIVYEKYCNGGWMYCLGKKKGSNFFLSIFNHNGGIAHSLQLATYKLRTARNLYKNHLQWIFRLAVWNTLRERDRGRCQYCYETGDTVDHIIPLSAGGTWDMNNLVTACKSCNSYKGNDSLKQFLQKYFTYFQIKGQRIFDIHVRLQLIKKGFSPYDTFECIQNFISKELLVLQRDNHCCQHCGQPAYMATSFDKHNSHGGKKRLKGIPINDCFSVCPTCKIRIDNENWQG